MRTKMFIDTVALQAFSSSGQIESYTYDRTGQVTGPGIYSPLISIANLNFTPFPLTAYDGIGRAGGDFGSLPKNTGNNYPYKLIYTGASSESGRYYLGIKQVYSNGYVRYSNIKQVILENSATTKFSVYPNPSKGIVGIKFDNSLGGQFTALIYNTQGQMAVKKEIVITSGSPYVELARLVPGVYWSRLTDNKNLESSVNQLLIK